MEPWAAEVVERFASYPEIGPSGAAVKVLFRCAADDLEPVRAIIGTQHGQKWSRGSHHDVALQLSNRSFAFTSQRLGTVSGEMRQVDCATLR